MQLSAKKYGNRILIHAEGRLDASWADYFKDALLNHVRQGEHHIVLDASAITYLSSAGIRSLMILHRELVSVNGSLEIAHAAGIVLETLRHTGLEHWLTDADLTMEDVTPDNTVSEPQPPGSAFETHVLDQSATLTVEVLSAWQPWRMVGVESCRAMRLERNCFALGIGAAGKDYEQARDHFGEFMAVAGRVTVHPPDERGRPDYLLAEKQFVPSLLCIQALVGVGGMSHLLRFRGANEKPQYGVSELIDLMLEITGSLQIGFVIIGEVAGLVGATLIRSPGMLSEENLPRNKEIRDWLSYCGERAFAGEQAVIVGMAARLDNRSASKHLPPLPARPEIGAHLHAAVFPYQPLPNGRIELEFTVGRFFNGPSPRAVMHLVQDRRLGIGLGESTLLSGACWCAPIINEEVLT